jgi:hypothetical protein
MFLENVWDEKHPYYKRNKTGKNVYSEDKERVFLCSF